MGNLLPFKPKTATFEMRITDDSMRGVGIRKGDVINFRRTTEFKDGDLVAVETPRGVYITLIYRASRCDLVVLMAAHTRCPCLIYSAHKINVLGVAPPVEDSPKPGAKLVNVEDLDWPDVLWEAQVRR